VTPSLPRQYETDKLTIAAAIMLITLVGMALSLFIPLLSLAMEKIQISPTLSGINSAFGGIGTLLIAPYVPRLAAKFGIRAVIIVAIVSVATSAIAFAHTPFVMWFPLRLTFGAGIGTLFVLSEYWISAAAPDDKRGLVMGIYATMLSIGFAVGPLLLHLTGTDGKLPFFAGASIMLLALLPLLAGKGLAPMRHSEQPSSIQSIMRLVPIATGAALLFGALETGSFALFPVYGLRHGMTETSAALLISIVAAGNIVSQMPLGLLSDMMSRKKLLLICAAFGLLGCIAMPLMIHERMLFYGLLFIWGGFIGGLYTVGLAHLSASVEPDQLAGANAAFVMLYSLGLIIGPPFVGYGMDLVGRDGFAAALGLILLLYILFAFMHSSSRRD
jgi:MFS family permease